MIIISRDGNLQPANSRGTTRIELSLLSYACNVCHGLTYSSFNQPAPRRSRHLLFPMTLSVGDVIFLSASADVSPVLCL